MIATILMSAALATSPHCIIPRVAPSYAKEFEQTATGQERRIAEESPCILEAQGLAEAWGVYREIELVKLPEGRLVIQYRAEKPI